MPRDNGGSVERTRSHSRLPTEKPAQRLHDDGPCCLLFENQVIAARQRNETRALNGGGELAAIFERADDIRARRSARTGDEPKARESNASTPDSPTRTRGGSSSLPLARAGGPSPTVEYAI